MASNITSESIDATYPVAGVDNDTQGFRDNFAIIKSNFSAAKEEIESLQNNTVKLNEANNFAGSYIIDANLQAVTEKTFKPGTLDNGVEVTFFNGHYQIMPFNLDNIADDITLTLVDFPLGASSGGDNEDRYAKMTLEIVNEGEDNKEVIFIIDGSGTFRYSKNWPSSVTANKISVPAGDIILIEFWSYNGGETVYANYMGEFREAS